MKKFFHILLKIIKWAAVILLVAAIFSALYNLTLPSESETTEYLLADQKAYIIEMDHLRRTAGNDVWPGWGDQSVPVIVYNESYAFLIGYPDPPDGWLKMPSGEFRGTSWQKVQNDEINGERYYRQPLPDPHITPENFTVKVGDRWVLTMQTKEYAAVSFYNGFRNELPPILSAVFPYRLFWNLLMGTAENYIAGMAHEAFHAHQGMLVPDRLAQAENAARLSSDYPWHKPENAAGWEEEIDRSVWSPLRTLSIVPYLRFNRRPDSGIMKPGNSISGGSWMKSEGRLNARAKAASIMEGCFRPFCLTVMYPNGSQMLLIIMSIWINCLKKL
ncbi:MAG: hypothetical protein LC662_12705 [Rhodothermaceae bacterium]|nr:hypothetical protein [Rhodothermaceae bacterium]